jgi:hypothetical protein
VHDSSRYVITQFALGRWRWHETPPQDAIPDGRMQRMQESNWVMNPTVLDRKLVGTTNYSVKSKRHHEKRYRKRARSTVPFWHSSRRYGAGPTPSSSVYAPQKSKDVFPSLKSRPGSELLIRTHLGNKFEGARSTFHFTSTRTTFQTPTTMRGGRVHAASTLIHSFDHISPHVCSRRADSPSPRASRR